MTLNSNIFTQAKDDRLPLLECSEIPLQLKKEQCTTASLTPD